MDVKRVHEPVELAIMTGVAEKRARLPYVCCECGKPTSTMHLVPLPATPGILKLCVGCYNEFVDLINACRAHDWMPAGFCRGESIVGYMARRFKAWWERRASES